MSLKQTSYISHQLNDSPAKVTYSFGKQQRFHTPDRRLIKDVLYFPPVELHTTKSVSFGYGKKSELINKTQAPSPDKYVLKREFETVDLRGKSFGLGRQENIFGDPLGGTRRKLPGVGAYKLDNSPLRQTNGGYMGSKLGSCFSQNRNNQVPGPGEYNVSSIDLSNSGNYVLSNFKNPDHFNYRFKTEQSVNQKYRRMNEAKRASIGPGAYRDIDGFNPEGTYQSSQHISRRGWTFGRSRRRSIVQDKDQTPGPGLYPKFSVFG